MAPRADQRELFQPAPVPVAPLDDASRLACLRLIRSNNVGPVTFRDLINHCGGAEEALAALPELAKRGGRSIFICSEDRAERELAAAEKAGMRPVFTIEPGYPRLLVEIYAPPPMLYLKGNEALLSKPSLAIVGSRASSAAGIALTRNFAATLGRSGFVIASGLARGIDAAAHTASLSTGTIAVVAGGIDVVYPPENKDLYDRISAEGCLLSEMPPGFEPRAKDFPRRNRLISGISYGVVVIEAAKRSGTLVTARMALEQNREVFAVPGHPLDPRAEGTNALLKNGATLATCPEDILEVLAPVISVPAGALEQHAVYRQPVVHLPPPLISDAHRTSVLTALGPHPATVDDLGRATSLPARELRVILMELDLAGRIERHGGSLVSLRPESVVQPGR